MINCSAYQSARCTQDEIPIVNYNYSSEIYKYSILSYRNADICLPHLYVYCANDTGCLFIFEIVSCKTYRTAVIAVF